MEPALEAVMHPDAVNYETKLVDNSSEVAGNLQEAMNKSN